ncbi:hypothetical protein NL108_008903, partial [Boleophthalmus pectinirostris]
PVYCQYKFHNLKMHRTSYEKHGDKMYFRDVNVIFTGLLNPQDLHAFLSGPPMRIEIHDRDKKQDDKTPVGLNYGINSGATLKRKKHFNYHGVASLNLSELLLGTTHFKVCLPIKCCTVPPDVDKATGLSVLPGHYIDANSELKARIKLACPLNFSNNNGSTISSCEALFGRVVCIFDHNNFAVMDKLRQEILKNNAEVFELGSHTLENTENVLSNYTTYFKHSQAPDLDFVSGFHLVDKKTQIVVVEGLRHKAVKKLRETVAMKLSGSKEEQVIVLYNSKLPFFKRIYDTLDLSLTPIILPVSLETILMEPLIYVKGTIPQLCLQCLLRLQQLCQVRSLTDGVQHNVFPSADMIQSLSRQYKTSIQQWKQSIRRLKTADYTPVHNYSIQTFNTNVLNKEWLQRQMAKLPGRWFTYSQEYYSGIVEPREYTVTTRTKQSPPDPAAVFTLKDQVMPEMHPKAPDQARVEELRKPWKENIFHGNILKPPLSRDPWCWSQRSQDFQLYRKAPPFFSTWPVRVHLDGAYSLFF